MKKLLAILVILGLAGVANAAFFEDFEGYTADAQLVGSGGWTDSGFGGWYRANYPAWTRTPLGLGAGPNAGAPGPGGPSTPWMGYAGRDVTGDATASGYTLEMLTGGVGPGNNGLIIGDNRLIGTGNPDSVANPADHIYIQSNHAGYTYIDAWDDGVNDSTELTPGGSPAGDMTGLGWYRVKWELDFSGTPSASAYIGDADDTTGALLAGWTLLATKTLPDGLDTPAEVAAAGFHAHKTGFVDQFSSTPEPVTLSILALGAGLALLRRRR